jgi:hypothetical protein
MVEAKLLRKKLKNGLIVDKWDLVTIIEKQQAEIESLKAHPVKELTDEEIRHIQAQCHLKNVGYDNFIMRFARAILRKAQE